MGPKAGTLAIFLLGSTLLSDAKPFFPSSLVSTTNIKTKISATLFLLGCISLYCLIKKRAASKQKDGKDKISENPSADAVEGKLVHFDGPFGAKLVHFDGPFVFTADDLLCATAEIVEESPYHIAYQATLENGSEVAVKWLRVKTTKGVKAFEGEVRALGKIRHANILALRAYYLGPQERVLVFDYMSKGSLSTFLHARGPPETLVPWATRMNIAKGISRGLAHLHDNENMIHENLTPNNVFIDEWSNVRIADYGLSRLMTSVAAANMIETAGALGYQAPEFSEIKNGSTKSDVYSLGVIILELLTGKYPGKPTNGMGLPQWVASVVKMKKEEEWANEVFDLELVRETQTVEVLQLMNTLKLALRCVDPSPAARPEAIQVVNQLEEIRPGTDTTPF
ncbi:hypothetical protein Bca4012_021122 [Brassica carinata]